MGIRGYTTGIWPQQASIWSIPARIPSSIVLGASNNEPFLKSCLSGSLNPTPRRILSLAEPFDRVMQLNWLYSCGICQLIPLKLWPNTAKGCNHLSTCMPQLQPLRSAALQHILILVTTTIQETRNFGKQNQLKPVTVTKLTWLLNQWLNFFEGLVTSQLTYLHAKHCDLQVKYWSGNMFTTSLSISPVNFSFKICKKKSRE